MAAKVLDSYAVMAFLEDEPGADLVHDLILKAEAGDAKLMMSVINLGEVWYSIARTTSPEIADRYIQEIRGMAIDILDADWEMTHQAARYKASGNISYADCFTAAAAKLNHAEIVTGDPEFKALESEIKMTWL